jgi:hypothetical protein
LLDNDFERSLYYSNVEKLWKDAQIKNRTSFSIVCLPVASLEDSLSRRVADCAQETTTG